MEGAIQDSSHHPAPNRKIRKRGSRGGTRQKKTQGQLTDGIYNLAGVELSKAELTVLSQGMKFAPSKNINKFDVFVDVEKYVRKLNIKKHFSQHNSITPHLEITEYQHTNLKNNSTFNPKKGTHHHVEVFENMVQEEIKDLEVKGHNNTNSLIREGIKQLESNRDIVVRPADKGGGVVLLTKDNYYGEIHRLLADVDTYHLLPGDPLTKLKAEMTSWVNDGASRSLLTKKEALYLVPKVPRTPVLYILPKIHKNRTNPPGRPIISGIGSLYS